MEDGWQIKVDWLNGAQDWLPVSGVGCGLQVGWDVQDVPVSTTRIPLGPGIIQAIRSLGHREQCLVQLHETGDSYWLPFENLVRIKDVGMRYIRAETGASDHAERFRLRMLAHALESWNDLTGALDRLDVDPLPHQIHLVHRIISSGILNWLIADDVGLGKTIEVGLLLAALKRRGMARRVLIVTPAGLTRQWKEEMRQKFDQDYVIYGRDFFIHDLEDWKRYDHVVGSIDLMKRDEHLEKLRAAGGWDIIIFDEAHKLTKTASGERAERYRLAETLRKKTDALILLTATPHQGKQDRFISLLELIRPDLSEQLSMLEMNKEIVADLILRNRKSEVTNSDGQFIFRGQQSHRVPIPLSREMERFNDRLSTYLRHGYKAGEGLGNVGRAIGFVMTTYRKLASSSIAAIDAALERRKQRLLGRLVERQLSEDRDWSLDTIVEGGDDQDDLDLLFVGGAEEFFIDESALIDQLIVLARQVRQADSKLDRFLTEVVDPLVQEGKKLLVFTEYRATQAYLREQIAKRFPHLPAPVLINGSMNLDDKLEAIDAFNQQVPFLISTEAGGEGINLHRACHVMVNYDLPWNPSRLVQRIGRLYRYGQENRVIVFNLHAEDNFDNSALSLMYQRVEQIVSDMAPVGVEFHDRPHAEIVGELLQQIDLTEILERAKDFDLGHTKDQIDRALERARAAQKLQSEILSHASRYDPNALQGTLGLGAEHVQQLVEGLAPYLDIRVEGRQYGGRVVDIRLPSALIGHFPEFGNRERLQVTAYRRLRTERARGAFLLDFESEFFRYLTAFAKSQEFDGLYACAAGPEAGVLGAFRLRWQNDQGKITVETFLPVHLDADGEARPYPAYFSEWLGPPQASQASPNNPPEERRGRIETLRSVADKMLAAEASRFKHPNAAVLIGMADIRSDLNLNQ
jgi:superfamily II DNA or RNA helicase